MDQYLRKSDLILADISDNSLDEIDMIPLQTTTRRDGQPGRSPSDTGSRPEICLQKLFGSKSSKSTSYESTMKTRNLFPDIKKEVEIFDAGQGGKTILTKQVLKKVGLNLKGRMVTVLDRQGSLPPVASTIEPMTFPKLITVPKEYAVPSTSKDVMSVCSSPCPLLKPKKQELLPKKCYPKSDRVRKHSCLKFSKERNGREKNHTGNTSFDYSPDVTEYERALSEKALSDCKDNTIKNLLSYDNLKHAYNYITTEPLTDGKPADHKRECIECHSTSSTNENSSAAEDSMWPIYMVREKLRDCDCAMVGSLLMEPHRILQMCWWGNCKSTKWMKACSQCCLTYCVMHTSKQIHGCATEPVDQISGLKRIGAGYASMSVKLMGREVEKENFNPALCDCNGECSSCQFHYLYTKYFNPKATTATTDVVYQQYALPVYDMDTNGNGKRGIPKLRDIIRRQRQDSDGGGTDSPDLDFIYDDTDTTANEIAELYSYTEQPEFQLNVKAFEDQMEQYNFPPCWQKLTLDGQKSVIMKLLDQLEISNKVLRMRAARCILYICQGCWAEVQSDAEQQEWAHRNSLLLYELGVFNAFTDLLNIEIENSAAAHVAMRKLTVSLADSQDLRVILSVLYTITEAIRNEKLSEHNSKVDSFTNEIVNATGDDLLVIKLLSMVTRFCSGAAPHFPMKKVLLLLWKLILVSLGGMEELRKMKAEKREKVELPPLDEDTMEIAKNMRASSPPASASDLLEMQNQKRNIRMFRKGLTKQSSLDDHDPLSIILETSSIGIGEEIMKELSECEERRPVDNNDRQMYGEYQQRPMTPPSQPPTSRGLPWKPKVRQRDIDVFLKNARMKFIGYVLQDDRESLAGLPQPIHEGVRTLKEHMYTSLADLQIQKEEEIARNPLSCKEEEIEMTPTEVLYQAMLPNLPQYMIALLKILLAAAPTSKAKTDSINIMSDVLPEEMPMTVVQSMKLGLDVNRHKEIIVKAVSAILLLLLKHFKLNHVCQFDFMSQHLVFANCIPLVLKFFNQNVMSFVSAINMIPILDFPACVIGDQPELTAESLEIGYAAPYSWRNIYSCINLLRILNKLTKWKHSRIMMLVVFKSAPILKRTLKVRHAMTQLYVLKLLKMQTKYLGRQWRKSNMKTISAIYAKVRHHLNDDWAFGNDLDARPWDFQGEECALRASVDRFNNRRYTTNIKDADYEPVDNCLNSVLGTQHDLSESFKKHYNLWLEQEVYNVSIDWDKLLLN